MPEFHVMNFTNSTTEDNSLIQKGRATPKPKMKAEELPPLKYAPLKNQYMNHEKRLMTEVNEGGEIVKRTLEGLVFPAHEIAKIINNKEIKIESLYIEFCHHDEASTMPKAKKGFSLILTGLDEDDNRVNTEVGEIRVYEFAASCPSRCPKEPRSIS